MRRLIAAMVATGYVAVAGGAPAGGRSVAVASTGQGEHRAAVIVDTGAEVKSVCVRFAEDSISGIEALQRAAVDPVIRAFPGKGAAVCSLCGTGCPADDSCLTCDSAGRFWSYSRAVAGATALRVSGVGASSTAVHDGDVEGWRWGSGGAPPFASVQQVCGETAPATTSTSAAAGAPPAGGAPTTPAPPPPSPAPAPATTIARSAPTAPRTQATLSTTTSLRLGSASASASAVPSSVPAAVAGPSLVPATSTTLAPSAAADPADGYPAASSRPGVEDGNGWAGVAGFAAVLTGLLVWAAAARRHRGARP